MAKEKKYFLVYLDDEEIEQHPFVNTNGEASFYRYITECFNKNWDTINIDCRYIDVAPNIQETWYNYAKENGINQTSLTMMLAMSGPKALEEVPKNTVRIWENCFGDEAVSVLDWKKGVKK